MVQPNIVQQDPLLATKLYIPRLGSNLISRPHLIARLNDGAAGKLTIISAPAGFGKTTLLSEWVNRKDEDGRMKDEKSEIHPSSFILHPSRVAWLSLDEGDNDPARFLSYFVAALQTIQSGLGQAILDTLRGHASTAQGDPEDWAKAALTTLLNEVASTVESFVLILDDYHVINTQSMHDLITFLVEHLPPQMYLIIASRTDPPLPLARLRVQGQVLELGIADLRFSLEEAATFLNQVMGLNLAADDVATLETRTEGWIAGLQLAALSMKNRQDISSFIASFTGSHHYVLDYLAEEVLNHQPESIQTFLLQTSILNRLTGPLCDALLGRGATPGLQGQRDQGAEINPRPPAQEILEQLEHANLFIIPLDDERRWYRYHHLFVEFLRNRLQNEASAQTLATLHSRAAEWYEQHGLAAEAAGHALAMADVDRAARLIEQRGRSVLNRSEMSTLRGWLERLPEELVRTRPQLSLFHAWALVLTGQLEGVEARIQDAERVLLESGRKTEIPGELTAIRATLAYFRRDLPQAINLFRQAFNKLPKDNLFLRGAVAMSLATACSLNSDLARAKAYFAQAVDIYETDNIHMALINLWNLAQLHVVQNELHQAAQSYRRAISLISRQIKQGVAPHIAGRLYIGLARVLYQWNELDEAAEHITAGIKLGRQSGDPVTIISGYVAQAWVKQAQGDTVGAFELLRQAEVFDQQNNMPGWQTPLAACQVQIFLKQADLSQAAYWAHISEVSLKDKTTDDSAGYHEDLRQLDGLTQARLLIAQKKPDDALARLRPMRHAAEAVKRTGQLIETLMLQALALKAQGHPTQAITMLDEALLLAEPEQNVRVFVDEAGPMADLLRQLRPRGSAVGYIDKLLAVFEARIKRQAEPAPLVDPLSDRELEILQLIGDGLSNKQISEKLFLTVGTVKWHINNIYSKLGVRRRTQALARARDLNLLS